MPTPQPHAEHAVASGGASRLAARAAILAGAGALGVLILQSSVAAVLARYDGKLAHAVTPWDARAALATARERITAGEKPDSPGIQVLARETLQRDTTLPAAIELQGLARDAHGDKASADRLFALSDAIGRRSLTTRLWLIQQAVQRGSVADALANFDIALRTSTEAPARLYPILVKACADPALAAAAARRVDQPVEWRTTFLDFAGHRGDPEGAARLLLAMRDRVAIVRSGAVPLVASRLVDVRKYALARALNQRFMRDGDPRELVADPQFARGGGYPFGWLLANADGIAAYPVRRGTQGGLGFTAEPGRGGRAASQLLMLPPGRYRFASTMRVLSDRSARPYWSIACADDPDGLLLQIDAGAPVAQGGAFTVPSGCEAQWLTLDLRVSFGETALSGEVGGVSLRRVQAGRTILN